MSKRKSVNRDASIASSTLADARKKEVCAICTCGLEEQLTYAPVFQAVDYYSKFMDLYGLRLENIQPKRRLTMQFQR